MEEQTVLIQDHDLLIAFREEHKREQAFTLLVGKYQQKLYWHIRQLVVRHDDADDILQNTFIKVWKNLSGFRAEANLYTWLYRIATNETMTWMAQQKKRNSLSLSDEDNPMVMKIEAEQGFDGNKAEWKLQQAIHTLPEKQKVVFNLRYYDEMPYEEMSVILDTSVGALKASYHHAVKKVEAFLLG